MIRSVLEPIEDGVGEFGGGALGGGDVGADGVGEVGDVLEGFVAEQAHEDGGGDRVAGADRVGLVVRVEVGGLAVDGLVGRDQPGAVGAAGQDDQVELKLPDQVVGTVTGQGVADGGQFVLVELDGRGDLAAPAEDAGVVVVLAEVDVEEADGVGGGFDEAVDGVPALAVALGEGAEADGVGLLGEVLHLGVPLEVVPGGVFDDVVGGVAVLEADEDLAGGPVGVDLDEFGVHAPVLELLEEVVAEAVVTDAGEDQGLDAVVLAESVGVDGDVEGGAAEDFLALDEVEEGLAEAYDGELPAHEAVR